MIELIACVGLHWIIKYGTILNKPRDIFKRIKLVEQLLKCSLCLGFWCGFVVGLFASDPIVYAFASAATCWFVDNLNNTLQSVEIKLDNSEK